MGILKKGSDTKKMKKNKPVDHLDVTESLGYQTYRKKARNIWTKEEDEKLLFHMDESLKKLGYSQGLVALERLDFEDADFAVHNLTRIEIIKKIPWDDIAKHFDSQVRKGKDLRKHWSGSLDPNLRKGKWTTEEDNKLLDAFNRHGRHWLNIAAEIPGRTEDQCAKRYLEVLKPDNARRLRAWALEEDLKLIEKVRVYGTKWRKISSEMDCRPSLTCRNRWRKIITMVVRSNAPEEIIKAVKENKYIDISNSASEGKSDLVKDSKEEKPSTEDVESNSIQSPKMSPENHIQVDNEAHNNEDDSENNIEDDSGEENIVKNNEHEDNQIDQIGITSTKDSEEHPLDNFETVYDHNLIGSPSMDSILLNKTKLNTEKSSHGSPFFRHRNENDIASPNTQQKQSYLLKHIASTFESLQSITNIKSPESAERGVSSFRADSPMSSLNSSHERSLKTGRVHVPNSSETEWKFTLKDGKGLSISNGTINNSALVKELIEQAKRYSLKISIHQHIHNHYSSNPSVSNMNTSVFDNRSTMNRNGQNNDKEFEVFGNDFLSHTPDFNSLSLTGIPVEHQTHDNNEYHEKLNTMDDFHRSPSYTSKEDSMSSKASRSVPSSDIRDLGTNRVSHFNYLPPTIKPKLASSDSPSNLSKSKSGYQISIDSENSTAKATPENSDRIAKQRKRRLTDVSVVSSVDSISTTYTIPNHKGDTDVRVYTEISKTSSSQNEEEGLDFWENLRTLAGNPEPEESEQLEDVDKAEDYGIFFDIIDNHRKTHESPNSLFHPSNVTKEDIE